MDRSVFFAFAILSAIGQTGQAQGVISASSGLVHYFEGRILVDGKVVEHKTAVFLSLKNGSVLSTEKGRAELLLTPDVYLRLDENSALRMTSNSLTDTRLELTAGSAIVDNLNASAGTPATLLHDGTSMRFLKPGIYRIDCEPGELQVFSGEAEVAHGTVKLTVDTTNRYYFALEMTISKYGDGALDEFYDWAHNRSDLIADQMQMASAEKDAQDADPGNIASLLGIPPAATPGPSGPYSSIFGYPAYGSSAYGSVLSPLTLGATTYTSPFPAGIFVVLPYRHRPMIGPHWPSGAGAHPIPPVVTRWPATGVVGSTFRPGGVPVGAPLRFPVGSTYLPVTGLPGHWNVSTVPRLPSSPAVSHPSASRVAPSHAVGGGHR